MKARYLHLAGTTLFLIAMLTSGCTFSLPGLPTLPAATPAQGANLPAPTMLPKINAVQFVLAVD